MLNLSLQVNLYPENRCPDVDCMCNRILTGVFINWLYGICVFFGGEVGSVWILLFCPKDLGDLSSLVGGETPGNL